MHVSSFVVPLFGGILIGAAASGFLLFNGRIAGISGILAGLLPPQGEDAQLRLAFVFGLLGGGLLLLFAHPTTFGAPSCSLPILAVAGLLVGLGTRIGNGCTSGHGVCGLARRSVRSLVATSTFMATGAITVYIVNHVLHGGF